VSNFAFLNPNIQSLGERRADDGNDAPSSQEPLYLTLGYRASTDHEAKSIRQI
jgi:hypothetical protein